MLKATAALGAALALALTGCGTDMDGGAVAVEKAKPEVVKVKPKAAKPKALPPALDVIVPARTGRGRTELPRFNAGGYGGRYMVEVVCTGAPNGEAAIITRHVGAAQREGDDVDPTAICDGTPTGVEVISRGGPQDVTIVAPEGATYTVEVTRP